MKKSEKLIVGNWKLNPTSKETAKKTFLSIRKKLAKIRKSKVVICPPFPYLSLLQPLVKGKIILGAQNVFWENEGAFTGEVGSKILKNVGVTYVIIGHSERRALGETNEIVNQKIKIALKDGLKVILCVGERERDTHGEYLQFLSSQIKQSLDKVQKKSLENVIVAYEPVWAIGKSDSEAITGASLHEMVLFVKKVVSDVYGYSAGMSMAVLYGGSVSPRNAEDILGKGEVDGLLVGRQSLEPEGFGEILSIAEKL
ncbi:MAG: triose-phosphate isomerase [Patescibacteria group bacterium]|nr:triose-phosphate isomerase [bacterium]MDZ4241113.1 triose-phosphate isomerase [Patescibacteria group bacterium]